MNPVELRRSLLRFVRLQMADEVPRDLQVARRLALGLRFLHLVLAEIDLTLGDSCADSVGAKGFRNGDELDGGRVASGPGSGVRDAIANVRQPGAELN